MADGKVVRLVSDDGGPRGDWQDRLSWDAGRRKLLRVSRNAELVLIHDDLWKGVIAWDDFRQAIVSRRDPPWDDDNRPAVAHREWTDSDITRVQGWLVHHRSLQLGRQLVADAVLVVAERTSSHEVRDYLNGLKWDAVPRVASWASRYLGAEQSPYTELVSRYYLTSAVARIMDPGCKVDSMVVLEGPQGARKSTALRVLFGEQWFTDTPLDLESKDRFVALRGRWCCEWAELDAMRKSDMARIKSYLSSSEDSYRPPYGRGMVKAPRQCVFAGTTNPEVYLRDATGNRRFWPIKCGRIDVEKLAAERDQIWAEAVVIYEDGQRWWPVGDEVSVCKGEQDARLEPDPWDNTIADWLARRLTATYITTDEVLGDCLNIEPGKRDRLHETRVGKILTRLGWRRRRRRVGGAPRWVYLPPEPDDPTDPTDPTEGVEG